MRILVMSDLHLNYNADYGESFIKKLNNNVDIVVIAGDLSTGRLLPSALQYLAEHFKNSQVLYIAGNHEWYGFPRKDVENFIKQKEGNYKNLHWLENKVFEYNGKRFVGCTMWYPPTYDALNLKSFWPDFKHILNANKSIFKWHQESKHFLENEVKEGDIVITHMLPSEKSVASQYKGERSNAFFVADMEKLIISKSPALWIHGHTHNSFDYELDKTRIVCNPYGYPSWIISDEPNWNFKFEFIIDI